MATLSNAQKKDWAKVIYLKENLTQKEIAARVDVTEKTLGGWIKAENWEQLKSSIIVTKEEELRRIYLQINELNTVIFNREQGERFAKNSEADTLAKLAATARNLETDTSIAEVIQVAKDVLNFVRKDDIAKAQELSNIFDAFIKSILN
jgi:DNA-binding XRE family transcriptional regulator